MHSLATVTVTFHPDIAVLARQIQALPEGCSCIFVDNGSTPGEIEALRGVIGCRLNTSLLELGRNIGLPAAINHAMSWLLAQPERTPDYVLLLDQDSIPQPGSVSFLLASMIRLAEEQVLTAVGPALLDPDTNSFHGFHRYERGVWRRLKPGSNAPPVVCHGLNGSGTMMSFNGFVEHRGLDGSLFIDHVDTEWGFWLQHHGYRLMGIPGAEFEHCMGQAGRRFWFTGDRVWPIRSPARHRYLFRNTIAMLKRDYVPLGWKVWALPKLFLTMAMFLAAGPDRVLQMKSMAVGLFEGLRMPRVRAGGAWL